MIFFGGSKHSAIGNIHIYLSLDLAKICFSEKLMKAVLLFFAIWAQAAMAETLVERLYDKESQTNYFKYKNITVYDRLNPCRGFHKTIMGQRRLENCYEYAEKLQELYELQDPLREKERQDREKRKRENHPELFELEKAIDDLRANDTEPFVVLNFVKKISTHRSGYPIIYKYKNIMIFQKNRNRNCIAFRKGSLFPLEYCNEYLQQLEYLYLLQRPQREKKEREKKEKKKNNDPELIKIQETINSYKNTAQ